MPRKTIGIDASASYDEDEYFTAFTRGLRMMVAGRALSNMSFTGLVTTKPVYQAGCGSYLLLSNYSSSSTPWSISVYAHSAAEGSTSKITLVVSDPASARSSKASFMVYGLTSGSPILRVYKTSKGRGSSNLLDGRRKVKLAATVEGPDFSEVDIESTEGDLTWSVDRSSGLSLRRQASSPLTRSISLTPEAPSVKVSLVLKPESLGTARDYTFYLSFTGTTGLFVESSVTVKANRPPSMGRIAISPRAGTELETEFTIAGYLWTDSDLPLTYEPFLAHPSMKEMNIILQSRSDKTSVTTKLPGKSAESDDGGLAVSGNAASDGRNVTQRIGLKVFDSLGAYALRFGRVTIIPRVIADREVSEYIEDSILSATTTDAAKTAAVTAALQVNKVDCSRAPNCTLLNREDCSSQPHTCGSCFVDFLGAAGYHNSRCAPAAVFLADYVSVSGDDDYYFDDDDDARRRGLESSRGAEWLPTQPGTIFWQRNHSSIGGGGRNYTGVAGSPLAQSVVVPRERSRRVPLTATASQMGRGIRVRRLRVSTAPCPNGCSGSTVPTTIVVPKTKSRHATWENRRVGPVQCD